MCGEEKLGKKAVSMTQQFLLSDSAKTLSPEAVMRMTEAEARRAFAAIRWHERDGEPACSRCNCDKLYSCGTRQLWKCKRCGYRFSLTSGTIFASRKLPFRDILAGIAIFASGGKRQNIMQLSRDLDVQYRTAFLLAHKIRDSLNGENHKLTVIRKRPQRQRAVAASQKSAATDQTAAVPKALSKETPVGTCASLMNQWISIDERLPEIGRPIWARFSKKNGEARKVSPVREGDYGKWRYDDGDTGFLFGKHRNTKFTADYCPKVGLTHWLPRLDTNPPSPQLSPSTIVSAPKGNKPRRYTS